MLKGGAKILFRNEIAQKSRKREVGVFKCVLVKGKNVAILI